MYNFNDESQEKIIDSLISNQLLRNKNVINLIELISKIDKNTVISINGAWGSGKTFFVKHIELLINFANNINEEGNYINKELATNNLKCISNLTPEQKEQINDFISHNNKNIRNFFENKQTNCLYFNAWEYDNNDDPILSIVYKIINDFPYLSSQMKEDTFKVFKGILNYISNTLSKGQITITDYIDSKQLIENINTTEELKTKVNELFQMLLHENSNKMVIIIDELDRCKPTYAIKLLEQIKHYIKSNNIIVILSTNIYQLSNTIKNLYGYDFNVEEYLDKIIDLPLSLQPIDKHKYIKSLNLKSNEHSNNWFTSSILAYVDYKKLEMRSINKFITLIRFYEDYIYLSNRYFNRIYRLLEYVFLPYCLGEQIFDSNNYNDFIKGKGFNKFYDYISSNDRLLEIIENCIYSNGKKENVNVKEEIKKIYDCIYNNDKEYFSVKVGDENIDKEDVKYFYDLCTMLNDFNLSD